MRHIDQASVKFIKVKSVPHPPGDRAHDVGQRIPCSAVIKSICCSEPENQSGQPHDRSEWCVTKWRGQLFKESMMLHMRVRIAATQEVIDSEETCEDRWHG